MDADSAFDAITEKIDSDLKGNASVESNTQESQDSKLEDNTSGLTAQQVVELEKVGKFKWEGKEWTPEELKKAALRLDDYTKKTQTLAEERKSLDSERKYYENLYADLASVRSNPELAREFVKVYPEKFHSYLKSVLTNTQERTDSQTPVNHQQVTPDVELLSRVNKLESHFTKQEVEKAKLEIKSTVDELAKKYTNVGQDFKDMVYAQAFEFYEKNKTINPEAWDSIFKNLDTRLEKAFQARYADLVKKQTTANSKAKDVEPGGGTVGRAPKKFKSLDEVEKQMLSDLQ